MGHSAPKLPVDGLSAYLNVQIPAIATRLATSATPETNTIAGTGTASGVSFAVIRR
jgi:hypothetical protein